MKKSYIVLLVLILISCSTGNNIVEEVSVLETSETSSTTTSLKPSEDLATTSTTEPVFAYTFDVEKMSPFTGLELQPEIWLQRPKRVIAFNIQVRISIQHFP